jgi:hypothetical protein
MRTYNDGTPMSEDDALRVALAERILEKFKALQELGEKLIVELEPKKPWYVRL